MAAASNDGKDELLLAVFRFKNRRPSDTQTASFCWRLRDALGARVQQWGEDKDDDDDKEDGEEHDEDNRAKSTATSTTTAVHLDPQCDDRQTPLDEFSARDRAWLRRGWPQLLSAPGGAPQVGAVWTVEWFPAYAGVLQAEQIGVDTIALRVVALDKWEWARHFLPSGECVHSAVSTSHVVLSCGSVDAASMTTFRAQLLAALATAKQRTGAERSAAGESTSLGHQKTPQFLVAAVRTAIDKVSEPRGHATHKPRGGMTDVGLHTGGAARDTCWTLVCAALRQALPPSCVLADKVLLTFSATLLESELDMLSLVSRRGSSEQDQFWGQVDVCMEILDIIGVTVMKLVEEGYDGARWLTKCQMWRTTLDDAATKWNEATARKFYLPDLLKHDDATGHQFPELAAPDQKLFDTVGKNAAWSSETCNAITQDYAFIDSCTSSPHQLLQYVQSLKPQDEAKKLVGLRATEKMLFAWSSCLTAASLDAPPFRVETGTVLQLLAWYRDHQTKDFYGDESRRLEQQSVYVVIVWIGFCLVHQHCAEKFDEVTQYQISLDWQRLDVCVLREHLARLAVLRVTQYIRDWNKRATGPGLFDLGDHAGTLGLARRLGRSLYEGTYAKVMKKWQSKCQSTWATISKRKDDLQIVRQEITNYEAEERATKQRLADEEARLLRDWIAANPPSSDRWNYQRSPNLNNRQTGVYKSEIRRLRNVIRQKSGKRDRLRRMPEFLTSPLPFDKADALQVLCLIAPPKDIDALAELCWRAQRSLCPSTPVTSIVTPDPGNMTWRLHFEACSGLTVETSSVTPPAQHAIAYPGALSIPPSFGPASIDDVWSEEAFVSSSSWFPDIANSSIHWQDDSTNGRWVNPFLVQAGASREFFTPRMLRNHGSDWQWAVEYPASDAMLRGNTTYAQWGQRVGSAEQEEGALEFCVRGALRSYPIQQVRRVFASVEADSLAWSNGEVAGLIRQALYQCGHIEGAYTPLRMAWHEDLEDEASVDKFCAMISRLVHELDHSPRRWECIPLVSELTGFLCQYSIAAMPSVHMLARMACRWAEDTRRLWQREGVSDVERKELRTRECVLYGYAALCYDFCGVQSLNDHDVEEVCKLVVLFHNAKLFVVGTSGKGSTIDAIQSKIDRMMADRIVTITKFLAKSPERSRVLTRLCLCIDSSTPEHLSWHRAGVRNDERLSSCFIARVDASDSHYLINLFSGAIETNGSLPSGLPASIRQMPLYRKLFDDVDFEVTRRSDVFTTTRNIHESIQYRFRIEGDTGELVVEEHGPSAKMQLCTETWCKQFAAAFPRRLAELYTHWYWMDQHVVFLRLPRVVEAEAHFVVKFDARGYARCYEIPRQDWRLSYTLIVSRASQYPVFVVADAKLLDVVSKFEAPEYIHVMRLPPPENTLEVSLPRFGLQFREDAQGRLVSVNHRGFVLDRKQQLDSGQMPRFRQYIVLATEDPNGKCRRLLIPTGQVVVSNPGSATGLVKIVVPSEPSAVLPYSAIDEHCRLNVFTPDTIEARLQFAAIFAASDTLLPWEDLGMTGGEAALQVLRGCTPSRPLSAQATQHLVSITTSFAYRTPVLTLLVGLLVEKSRRLGFLFDSDQMAAVKIDDALDEYRHRQSNSWAASIYPFRQCLSRSEEWDLLGSVAASETVHSRTYRIPVVSTPTSDEEPPVDSSFVRTVQCEIASYHTCSTRSGEDEAIPAFPISRPSSNEMGEQMTKELQESWVVFHRHDTGPGLTVPTEDFLVRMVGLLSSVRWRRESCDAYLKRVAGKACTSVNDRLMLAIGRHGRLNIRDMMRSVLDENVVLQFAPGLNPSARELWKRSCICFLELCVLEDKLERIIGSHGSYRMVEELQTAVPSWKSEEHPYWLVFEVEGRLQIRQEQYVIAKHLIDNPGSICQLNMGRGKTRVILPMLFLYHSYNSRQVPAPSQLVRAHFLTPLLSETRDFMWRVLTSGVLQLPFIELPFNRSCSLGRRELRMMQHVLCEAKRNGSVIMVAPEHRLSLELKRVEMQSNQESDKPSAELCIMDDVLNAAQYVDVFDESDALLHHGYHLVYAVGASIALDGGSNRWLAAEALLRILVNDTSARVQSTLRQFPDLWSFRPEYLERYGGNSGGGVFNGFQLSISSSSDVEDGRKALKDALVEDLMDHAPFDLEWLRVFSIDVDRRAALVRLLTDATIDVDEAMKAMPSAIRNVKQQVLALRGLLSFGVLENCLQKRYRVNYGHPPSGSRPKAIAIPYQAADLPAERSEFSHPDVGILLTLLSFYHSGLSDTQIRRAFEMLLSLDPSESARYYGEWYNSVALSITDPRKRQTLESLTHISLDNAHQFGTVCTTYRHAIEVVNFFLNFCVFPRDTRQFPSRLSRTAWDLVRGSKNIGFSGTNDTHALLPLGVSQHEPDEPSLRGTNGKMIKLLLDATRGFELLPSSDQETTHEGLSQTRACWQSLLTFAINKKCDALIDTGALLAGVSNHEAARFLVRLPGFAKQGVTYYDTRRDFDGWVVLVKASNLVQPHKTSSLRESDTFVIFDEARSRGSDMKLLSHAVALLTLCPTITKDKLMQGAGRMRQLGANQQTLWLTSTQDVYTNIIHQKRSEGIMTSPAVSVLDILSWVVDNTQRQCTLGLLEWAQSGCQYHSKEVNTACELQADDWSLEGQYAGAQRERLISEIVQTKVATKMELMALAGQPHYEPRTESDRATVTPRVLTAMHQIRERGEMYGNQDAVCVTSLGEECERELQIEEEQQEERECVRHELDPCTESIWDYRSLLNAISANELGAARVLKLDEAVKTWLQPRECCDIAWARCKIYGTANFWSTVQSRGRFARVSSTSESFVRTSYLRHIHGVIFFPDGTTLLLSEREEDSVLKMLHAERLDDRASERRRGQFAFVQLPFLVGFLRRMEKTHAASIDVAVSSLPLVLGWDRGYPIVPETMTTPFIAVVACCLLNGDTDLFLDCHPIPAEAVLQALLGPLHQREETLQAFIALRGFTARWKRSSLHAIAKRLDLEDDSVQP